MTRVTQAAGLATVAFAGLARQSITSADEIAKAARNAGLSASSYQSLGAAFELAGSNSESLVKGTQALTRQVEQLRLGSISAVDGFAQLGLSYSDLQGQSPEDQLRATIAGLQGLEDVSQRTALAQILLGRAGRNLGTLLTEQPGQLAAAEARFRSLGIAIDGSLLGTAEEANDNLFLLGEGIRNNFTNAVLEAIQSATGLNQVDDIIREVGATVRRITTAIIDFGSAVIEYRAPILGFFGAIFTISVVNSAAAFLGTLQAMAPAIRAIGIALAANPLLALATLIGAVAGVIIFRIFSGDDGPSAPDNLTEFEQDIIDRNRASAETDVLSRRLGSGLPNALTAAFEEADARSFAEIRRIRAAAIDPPGSTTTGSTGGDSPIDVVANRLTQTLADFQISSSRSNQDRNRRGDTEQDARRRELDRRALDLRAMSERLLADNVGEVTAEVTALSEAYLTQARALEFDSERVGSFNEQIQMFTDGLSQNLSSALSMAITSGNFSSIGDAFVDTIQSSILTEVQNNLKTLFDDFFGSFFDSLSASLSGSASSPGSVLGSLAGDFFAGAFQDGGVVPGSGPVPIVAHGGEVVLNADQQQALLNGGVNSAPSNTTINISGNVDDRAIEQVRGIVQNSPRQVGGASRAFDQNTSGLRTRR